MMEKEISSYRSKYFCFACVEGTGSMEVLKLMDIGLERGLKSRAVEGSSEHKGS